MEQPDAQEPPCNRLREQRLWESVWPDSDKQADAASWTLPQEPAALKELLEAAKVWQTWPVAWMQAALPHSVAKVRAAMMQDLQPVTGSGQRRLTRFSVTAPHPGRRYCGRGLAIGISWQASVLSGTAC